MIKVGLIGLGTVGSGVYKTLQNFSDIKITKIAVNDITKKRNIENFDYSLLTQNPYDIVNDNEIEIIIEVMGGTEPAYELLTNAIKKKKHIVTANKELLAKKGEELFQLAREYNVVILYEGAVAGGIPIIMPIKMSLCANKIHQIAAILNGTTNYILTKMSRENADYETVLKEAQEKGYAEFDPTGDVDGYDAQYKLATLATISFNKRIDVNQIYREGITKISAHDIAYAKQLGYVIKLIALAKLNENGEADVRVHPMLLKRSFVLANINDVTNAVMLDGHPIGRVIFSGAGAGEFPTASSVSGDVLMIAKSIAVTSTPLPMTRCTHNENAKQIKIDDTFNKYYIRILANDTPGVIGTIGNICGEHNINISSLIQKESRIEDAAEIVVITGICKEADIQNAISEMNKSTSIREVKNLIRVME